MLEALPVILDKELPVKTAYWFRRAIQQLQSEFVPFEESRRKLVEKYGERDEKGELLQEDSSYKIIDLVAFQAEYGELALEEIEIKYEPVTIDQLVINVVCPKCGNVCAESSQTAKVSDLLRLGRLIKDEDPE